jgi:hypothetical protein
MSIHTEPLVNILKTAEASERIYPNIENLISDFTVGDFLESDPELFITDLTQIGTTRVHLRRFIKQEVEPKIQAEQLYFVQKSPPITKGMIDLRGKVVSRAFAHFSQNKIRAEEVGKAILENGEQITSLNLSDCRLFNEDLIALVANLPTNLCENMAIKLSGNVFGIRDELVKLLNLCSWVDVVDSPFADNSEMHRYLYTYEPELYSKLIWIPHKFLNCAHYITKSVLGEVVETVRVNHNRYYDSVRWPNLNLED